MRDPSPPHIPVLVAEVLEVLGPSLRARACVLDGTLGAGGHARILLPRIAGGRYVGVDRDPGALALAGAALAEPAREASVRLDLVHGRFGDLVTHAGEDGVDVVLLDVGISSMQVDEADRGFSFAAPGPLDMRMDPEQEVSARELVARLDERALADTIYRYGEERRSRAIARAIVEARRRHPIKRTEELADIIERAVGRGYERGRIHPATRTFQALRIAVNDELGELERALSGLRRALRPGGRAAVIAFHSLEDRLVKRAFQAAEREGWGRRITKKPRVATDAEVARNRRARSAKLRALERTRDPGA